MNGELIMDGIIPVIKPPGITSHDAVGIMRRLLHERRIGHTGTLDPMAMGVLPIFIGKATRLVEYTSEYRKVYVAEGQFGISTDTEDITGTPLPLLDTKGPQWLPPSFSLLQETCTRFEGVLQQTPSMYSAIKINGRRAYEWAREGVPIEMPSREITIYSTTLLAYTYPWFTIRVECSGGTYIRSLLRDIGIALGIPCTMSALLRSQVGPYVISDAATFEEVESQGTRLLRPMEYAVSHIPRLDVNEKQALLFTQGQTLSVFDFSSDEIMGIQTICALFLGQEFIGIGERRGSYIKGKKIIYGQS